MKNLFLRNLIFPYLVLALAPVSTLHSQPHRYIPFPDSNYVWVVEYAANEHFGFQYVLTDKIEINNQVYTILSHVSDSILTPSPFFYYGIRNDTAARKVYVYDKQSGKEKLLYDFSLRLGDTVPPDLNGRYAGSIITDIDSIDIYGNTHLVYHVGIEKKPYIEGIGSVAGPIESTIPIDFGYRLMCTMIQSTLSSYYTLPGVPCKLFHFTDVTELKSLKEGIEISPNPVNDYLFVKTEITNYTIRIYSFDSRLVFSENASLHKTFDLSNLSEGIYSVIISKEGKIFTQKIIVRN